MTVQCTFESLEALRAVVGSEAFVSDWILIDQRRINLFAEEIGRAHV